MRKRRPLPSPLQEGTIALPCPDQTYVYRVYCTCGDLLYVGMTNSLYKRFSSHHREQAQRRPGKFPWLIRAAARIEWSLYETREDAERVEHQLIRDLRPRHNVTDAPPPHRRVRWEPLPWPTRLTQHELQWRAICAARGTSFLAWLTEHREAA